LLRHAFKFLAYAIPLIAFPLVPLFVLFHLFSLIFVGKLLYC
jgi:hypothetical protein